MKNPEQEYIIVGKTGAAYGIKGWLKIHSYTERMVDLLQYNPWYLADETRWQSLEIEAGRPHGKGLIAKFKGIETPEQARTLAAKKIAVKREQLAPLPQNEYYWADLLGLIVIDQKGQQLGQVKYLLATGSNDVLVIIDPAGKEHAIPYLLGSVIKNIDLDEQIISVDWDLI